MVSSNNDNNNQPKEIPLVPANVNDLPTEEDDLGFEPYFMAIAKFLTSPGTKPPITISIEGKWGSGNCTFAHFARERGINA